MTLTTALFNTISSLSIMIILGFAAVKFKILKYEDSKVLSRFALYFLTPCAMLDAFQYEFSADKLTGMGIALCGALIAVVVFALLSKLLTKLFKLSVVEYTSLEYPNAGNFMLPLIASAMGGEWVIYCSACFIVMNLLMFTHGQAVISGEKRFNMGMIFKNVVLISTLLGFVMFLLNWQIPGVLGKTISSTGSMMGPVYMFTIGMIIGNADLKKVFLNSRAYLLCFGRLIVYPLAVMLVLCVCGILNIHSQAPRILLIVVLTAGAPTAVMITQFAQLYRTEQEAEFSSIVNILSTVLCLATMPALAYLYQTVVL